jgi:hypothetical protein
MAWSPVAHRHCTAYARQGRQAVEWPVNPAAVAGRPTSSHKPNAVRGAETRSSDGVRQRQHNELPLANYSLTG